MRPDALAAQSRNIQSDAVSIFARMSWHVSIDMSARGGDG
jgi:hypothetical protein